MTLHDAIRRMHDANTRLEEHLATGPTGPESRYEPPPPVAAGYPLGPPMTRRRTDHEHVLEMLQRLKAHAERLGHHASVAVYVECIQRLVGITDPRDTPGERQR